MRTLRRGLLLLALVAIAIAVLSGRSRAGFGQTQRDQISVALVINVTPAPMSERLVPQAIAQGPPISARFAMRAVGSRPAFDGPLLSFAAVPPQAQRGVKVEAEVSPNPNATLLYANSNAYQISGTAGTTVTQSCAYTVTVDTTQASWTLKDGLSQNPSSGATSFPGGDMGRNNHIGPTPLPTASPFIVYPTSWEVVGASGGAKTYCVDLVVTIPATTPGGAYATNALYTVYW